MDILDLVDFSPMDVGTHGDYDTGTCPMLQCFNVMTSKEVCNLSITKFLNDLPMPISLAPKGMCAKM